MIGSTKRKGAGVVVGHGEYRFQVRSVCRGSYFLEELARLEAIGLVAVKN